MSIDVVVAIRVTEDEIRRLYGGTVETDEDARIWRLNDSMAFLGRDVARFYTGFGGGITVAKAIAVVEGPLPGLFASLDRAEDVAIGLEGVDVTKATTFAQLTRKGFVPGNTSGSLPVFEALYGSMPSSPMDAARILFERFSKG